MPQVMPVSRKRNSFLRAKLLQLQIGEGIFLPKAEWKTKTGPAHIVARLKKTMGLEFDYGFKTDGTGWLFKRVK